MRVVAVLFLAFKRPETDKRRGKTDVKLVVHFWRRETRPEEQFVAVFLGQEELKNRKERREICVSVRHCFGFCFGFSSLREAMYEGR
jgi:hypothetical protein